MAAEDESDPITIEYRAPYSVNRGCEMPRSPYVIIVEKRNPGRTHVRQAEIASRRNAPGAVVAKDPYASVVERAEFASRRVNRAVIDDDDVHLYALLSKRGGQRDSEERPPVAGRNDDRNVLHFGTFRRHSP